MRTLRRSLPDRAERSEELWRHLIALPPVAVAETVLVFTPVLGEPETRSLLVWCAATGRLAAVPEADVDPTWPDVVVVPGLAFTAAGERLGQGGGYYDRTFAARPNVTRIGFAYAGQEVEHLPVEPHDIRLHGVLTEVGYTAARKV